MKVSELLIGSGASLEVQMSDGLGAPKRGGWSQLGLRVKVEGGLGFGWKVWGKAFAILGGLKVILAGFNVW